MTKAYIQIAFMNTHTHTYIYIYIYADESNDAPTSNNGTRPVSHYKNSGFGRVGEVQLAIVGRRRQ